MAKLFCEHCGEPIAAGSRFCEACGQPVETHEELPVDGNKQRKGQGFLTYVAIGTVVLIIMAVLLVYFNNPVDIFNREPGEEKPIAIEEQEMSAPEKPTAGSELPKQEAKPPAIKISPSPTVVPIQDVKSDHKSFFCISTDGPTTLTITASTSPSTANVALRWRLKVKSDGRTTDWETVSMNLSENMVAYTFDANTWEGTNNFYYPPMMGESWFEYQLFTNGGAFQTETFREVTFFPCAQ